MLLAITHLPSKRIEQCELTYVARAPIDYHRALRQHEAYCRVLQECGATVRRLDGNVEIPDCAFVEDTAVVLDELAVMASMGIASRRAETAHVERELARHREVRRIDPPGTIEGGDVLQVGRTLLVGRSPRTNEEGIRAFDCIVRRFGYRVITLPVYGCLHLKTACTALDETTLLLNPRWLETEALAGYRLVEVDENEPWAANAARVGRHLCLSAAHTRTARKIEAMDYQIETVDLSEFAKAEAGPTCLSILLNVESR
ncbi:MAG: dimethylarginine dimethylaminohydrolase family protein [Planctomycetota bacterium]|jgi:dimethylargininase